MMGGDAMVKRVFYRIYANDERKQTEDDDEKARTILTTLPYQLD